MQVSFSHVTFMHIVWIGTCKMAKCETILILISTLEFKYQIPGSLPDCRLPPEASAWQQPPCPATSVYVWAPALQQWQRQQNMFFSQPSENKTDSVSTAWLQVIIKVNPGDIITRTEAERTFARYCGAWPKHFVWIFFFFLQ